MLAFTWNSNIVFFGSATHFWRSFRFVNADLWVGSYLLVHRQSLPPFKSAHMPCDLGIHTGRPAGIWSFSPPLYFSEISHHTKRSLLLKHLNKPAPPPPLPTTLSLTKTHNYTRLSTNTPKACIRYGLTTQIAQLLTNLARQL